MTHPHPGRDLPCGILPIDKAVGMTSHDIVDAVRRLYGLRQVGHSGTLDPAASGLMIVLLGKATKVASLFSDQDKTYHATIHLGATSDTGDSDGAITRSMDSPDFELSVFPPVLARFTGDIEQRIPEYAAVRTDGQRRYELARAGKEVPPASRVVTIHDISLLSWNSPRLEIRVNCAKGTYIRSLAEAVGEELGCGAYLESLRRERVGRCDLTTAYSLDWLRNEKDKGQVLPTPAPFENFLNTPIVELQADGSEFVRHGRPIGQAQTVGFDGVFAIDDPVLLRVPGEGVVAVARACFESAAWPVPETSEPLFRYQRVLI